MLKLVILLSVVACAFGAAVPEGMLPQLDGRIVGGTETTISSFPWQISLQRYGSHSCGGSIYSSKIIVTAALCLNKVSINVLWVRAGSTTWGSGGTRSSVAAFMIHEGYNPQTYVNDIAVIRLTKTLGFSSTIKPIALAFTAPADGAAATISGWGAETDWSYSHASSLRYADVKIVSASACATYNWGSNILPSMICATAPGKDTCHGDHGDPLVSGGALVGVASWGYSCAKADFPGVYADVAALRSWVISAADSLSY